MTRPTLCLTLAILAGLVIFAISAAPGPFKHALHTQGSLHFWLHLLSFALLAYMLLGATRSYVLKAILATALFLFGFYTEARESHKDGWPIEQADVRTDAEGILLGSALNVLAIAAPHRPRSLRNTPKPGRGSPRSPSP